MSTNSHLGKFKFSRPDLDADLPEQREKKKRSPSVAGPDQLVVSPKVNLWRERKVPRSRQDYQSPPLFGGGARPLGSSSRAVGLPFKKASRRRPKLARVMVSRVNHSLRSFVKSATGSPLDPLDESYSAGLATAQSIIDPGTIYTFRLAHYATVSSSVGGVVAEALVNDPSSWSEWSSLTALFSSVRIRRATLHVINAFSRAVGTTTGNGNWQPLVFNALYDEVAAPTSYDATVDSPNFVVYNHNFDTTAHGARITLNFTGVHTPLWGDTSAPHSSTSYAGSPGCFQIYADGQTVSTVILSYIQVLDLEFMNRF